jgi:hypothetical protein
MTDGVNLNQAGRVAIVGQIEEYENVTVKEVHLNESLLNPGLQTAIVCQNFVYGKNEFDKLKGREVNFTLVSRKKSQYFDTFKTLDVSQKVYRLDNRQWMPTNVGQTEEFTLHLCDKSLIEDAKSLVSKSWKCTSPTDIVEYVLGSCARVENLIADQSNPSRDYIAENIHPFQVVAQQSNVALDGDDPSFLHYMTYENRGTHYFRSLKRLIQAGPVATYTHTETGLLGGKDHNRDPYSVITFEFPCDFDLLSDILNGVDENGININSLMTFNPLNIDFSQIGGMLGGSCGIGSGNAKVSMTNKGTAGQQNGCETDVESHLLKRQARMGLLEKDKIAFRMVVPWNPDLNVGKIIRFEWKNKNGDGLVYGSGDYLISSLTHKVLLGGFSTTTVDCITNTFGNS